MNLKNIILYYLLLLIILCSWTDTVNAPNMILRLLYLVALIVPIYVSRPCLYPHIIICFTTVSIYGFSASYLPTEYYYYTYITMVLSLLPYKNKNKHKHIKIPRPLVLFAIYTLLIDLYTSGGIVNTQYGAFITIFLMFFIYSNNKSNDYLFYVYIIITLTFCYFFFFVGEQFVVEHMGQDRIMWKDPNYMGCLAGIGVVCAYYLLTQKKQKNNLRKYVFILTILIGFVMLLKNGSRGSVVAVAVGITSITMFTKISVKKKLLMSVAVVLSLVLLYNFGLFSLLEERMAHDVDGTGSGRTLIWALKLSEFFQLSTFDLFTGIGYRGGFMLGFIEGYGFHNDFVAVFVDYGIIGSIIFICMLLYPLFLVRENREQRGIVVAMTLYLLTVCMTLEPLSGGRLPFYYLYLFIVVLANENVKKIR